MENYELKLENFKKGFQQTFRPDDAYSERFETNLGYLLDILNSYEYARTIKAQETILYIADCDSYTVDDYLCKISKYRIDNIDFIEDCKNPDMAIYDESEKTLYFMTQKDVLDIFNDYFQESFWGIVESYLDDHPDLQEEWIDPVYLDSLFTVTLCELWDIYTGLYSIERLKTMPFCKTLKQYLETRKDFWKIAEKYGYDFNEEY